MIDNFEVIKRHLTFESDFDRYIVHILKRTKDSAGKSYGANETNRLIKTFYISSMDYLERKQEVIKKLCHTNEARAYILPQVRNNGECLKQLLILTVNNLDNPTIKPDHLIRSAYCGYHGSRDKKWILDLDNDNLTSYTLNSDTLAVTKKTWTPDEILAFVKNSLTRIKKNPEDAYMVPTKNGNCIITSPFDLDKAFSQCNMMFQGVASRVVDFEPIGPGEYQQKGKQISGWLIRDGMALLYME